MGDALEIINLYLRASDETREWVHEMIAAYISGPEEDEDNGHI